MDLFLTPSNHDEKFWWEYTGSILQSMLEEAGYSPVSIHQKLLIFYKYVLPLMGKRPAAHEKSPRQSFMTDDHTPIELSWSWPEGQRNPMVRFSIEPMPTAGMSSLEAMRDLMQKVRPLCTDLDCGWFEYFASRLTVDLEAYRYGQNCSSEDSKNESMESQFFAAFELAASGNVFKAYFIPHQRASLSRTSSWELCKGAVLDMVTPYDRMRASFRMLSGYISESTDIDFNVEILGIDCVPGHKSRIKVYVRSSRTSFDSIRKVMTMSGQINVSDAVLNKLKTLWTLVLGLPPDWNDYIELPLNRHRTAGMLYYFEIRPNSVLPTMKVYIPVRHYACNDLQVAKGLSTFFGGPLQYKYLDMLRRSFRKRNFERGLGTHTYITASINHDQLKVTSYLNPQVYSHGVADQA